MSRLDLEKAVYWARENDECYGGWGKPYPDVIDADTIPGYVGDIHALRLHRACRQDASDVG